jgi:hypothetical protein
MQCAPRRSMREQCQQIRSAGGVASSEEQLQLLRDSHRLQSSEAIQQVARVVARPLLQQSLCGRVSHQAVGRRQLGALWFSQHVR